MKHLLLPMLCALMVTACSGSSTLVYDIDFPTTNNPDRMSALTLATRNIMERRLDRLDAYIIDYDIEHDKEANTTQISVEIDDATAAKKLNQEMMSPFSFEFRVKADEKQAGDIEVENVGFFRAIGIGKEDIDWVLGEAIPDDILKKGMVVIGFTDAGMEKANTEFAKHTGKSIGLFVRGQLTATINLPEEEIGRTVAIQGLPSPEIAKVFADDMNVGIHVVFHEAK